MRKVHAYRLLQAARVINQFTMVDSHFKQLLLHDPRGGLLRHARLQAP
jgi:hypothetical protein